MLIVTETESGLYLRLTNNIFEIHMEVFNDKSDTIEAVASVYHHGKVILKCFGLTPNVLSKIREVCL